MILCYSSARRRYIALCAISCRIIAQYQKILTLVLSKYRTLPSPQKTTHVALLIAILTSLPSHLPFDLWEILLFSTSVILSFLRILQRWNHMLCNLVDWLFHSVILWEFTQVVACIICFYCWVVFHNMDIPWFVYPFTFFRKTSGLTLGFGSHE